VIQLQVEPVGEKHLRISGINPVVLDCLHSLPEILAQRDSPAARARLLPDPTKTDERANSEWQRLIAPELRHVFVSAGETVARDLTSIAPDDRDPQFLTVTFPIEHVPAWISALNQTRLILGELHKVTDADMIASDFNLKTAKGLAVFRIHVLGYLLHLFVELEAGRAEKL
jgi:hypothetical protein